MWRLSMASFIVGALPQAIKVFCMRGVPLTQTLVAFLVVSFLVPEILRMVAGSAGAIELHPMPIVTKAKTTLVDLQLHALGITLLFACVIFSYSVFVPLFYASTSHATYPELSMTVRTIVGIYIVSIGFAITITLAVSFIGYDSFVAVKLVSYFARVTPRRCHENLLQYG